MTNYRGMLTDINGSCWARWMRILLTVYQLADFCSGPCESTTPVGVVFREQVEALLPGYAPLASDENLAVQCKNHAGSHVGYRACGPTSIL